MIEYIPWSADVCQGCLTGYSSGQLPALDLDLTAKCSYSSCIYCDSRPRVGASSPGQLGLEFTLSLLRNARKLGLQWIYCCGLGEPLEDERLAKMVEAASQLGVKISLFTNGILIDRDWAKRFHDNGVCLILKLDTFDEVTFDRILGGKGRAKRIYRAFEELLKAGYASAKECAVGKTDLAFSIVPTMLNLHHIERVVETAKLHNVFPSVGELERAGKSLAERTYSELAIREGWMADLKRRVESLLWKGYVRPVCPAIIAGLHIDDVGDCIVDAGTGLNCKWFLLGEPRTVTLGNVRERALGDLLAEARDYRRKCFQMNTDEVARCESVEYVFGGCGGNPSCVIRMARACMEAARYGDGPCL